MPDIETIPRPAVAFSAYKPEEANHNGILAQLDGGVLRALVDSELPWGFTHFGYIEEGGDGYAKIHAAGRDLHIPGGFYFSIPGAAEMRFDPKSRGLIVSAPEHTGFLWMGWLEYMGRLRYIDGCTDSLLIPPIKLGDPCLNLLFFPKHTDQTMHTHPSDRIGMILSGYGECITQDEADTVTTTPLKPGTLFCIHAHGRHKFRTDDRVMRVLAYHPDSDFGPTDEVHPMINRTMVDGVSASKIKEIHTTK